MLTQDGCELVRCAYTRSPIWSWKTDGVPTVGTGPDEREIPTSRPVPTVTKKPPGRRMRSTKVRIGMIGALSLTVAACGSNDDVTAYCVDRNSYQSDGSYRVIDDDYCDDDGYHGSHGGYFWYYGGSHR